MVAGSPNEGSFAYIGIDPGVTGAIAVINGANLTIFALPVREEKRNGKVRTRLDVAGLCNLAASLGNMFDGVVTLEDVWIAGGDNPASVGELMRIVGACEAAFTSAGFGVNKVAPQAWKASYGIAGAGLIEADRSKRRAILKTRARDKAAELWPDAAAMFGRVKDADRAEAALIAEFGRLANFVSH